MICKTCKKEVKHLIEDKCLDCTLKTEETKPTPAEALEGAY